MELNCGPGGRLGRGRAKALRLTFTRLVQPMAYLLAPLRSAAIQPLLFDFIFRSVCFESSQDLDVNQALPTP